MLLRSTLDLWVVRPIRLGIESSNDSVDLAGVGILKTHSSFYVGDIHYVRTGYMYYLWAVL